MHGLGPSTQGAAEGGVHAAAEETHAKSLLICFKFVLFKTLTHQTSGGLPVSESCECMAASADDAAPLRVLTTPPFRGCEVVGACYMI